MSEKKNVSGMFGHHEDEDKPAPEIRGGNRLSDYMPDPRMLGGLNEDGEFEAGCSDECSGECSDPETGE